jgi:hypothetical protein
MEVKNVQDTVLDTKAAFPESKLAKIGRKVGLTQLKVQGIKLI